MKYCFLSILILILGCSSNPDTNQTSIENNSKAEQKTLTAEDYDVDEPIVGGPADFSIKVNGLTQGGVSRLIGFYVDQNYIADTSSIKDGKISFVKPEGYTQGFYYVSLPGDNYIQLLLGEDQKFTMVCDLSDIQNTMKVDGDLENSLYYETAKYEATINPIANAMASKMQKSEKGSQEYENAKQQKLKYDKERLVYFKKILDENPTSLFANFKYGGQNPVLDLTLDDKMQVVQYRKDFWNNVNFNDRRLLYTPMIGNKLKRYTENLTAQNPDSIIVAADDLVRASENYPEYFKVFTNWIVKKFEPTKTTLMDPEAVFVHMVQNYFTHEKAFWSDSLMTNTLQQRAYEMGQSLIGSDAPNVISKDQFGKRQELLSKTADYLVVYMFNPDCEHCQEETPLLIDYYNKNKSFVDVMAIAIETEEKLWKEYIKKLGFPFTTVYDPTNRSIYAKYYVDITPELYVINPDRKIIGKNLKVFQIQTVIDQDKNKRGK